MNKEIPETYVTSASIKITNDCNFACHHCGLGEPTERAEITPAEMELVLERISGPLLNSFILYGGEPRVSKYLVGIMGVIKDHFHQQGRKLSHEMTSLDMEAEAQLIKERNEWLISLGKERRDQLDETGELGPMLYRFLLDSEAKKTIPVSVQVFTNGFGMSSPEKITSIVNDLAAMGVNRLAVSMDLPHRQYVREKGIALDYKTLKKLMSALSDEQKKMGITPDLFFISGSVGEYVVPVGRASQMPWPERIALAGRAGGMTPEQTEKEIKESLSREFEAWPLVKDFSHCYCGPAKVRRAYHRLKNFQSENQFLAYGLAVEPDLKVNACGFGVMPPVGDLRQQAVAEIYQAEAENLLYQVLDEEGPQGLAGRLTGISKEKIKEEFLERTPCGLCEDLYRQYPDQINEMINTPDLI